MDPYSILEEIWRTYVMTDCVLVCCDGTVKAHTALLGAASPCLKEAMADVMDDSEDVHVFLPDSSVLDVISLLSLIYLGTSAAVSREATGGILEAGKALGLSLSCWQQPEDEFEFGAALDEAQQGEGVVSMEMEGEEDKKIGLEKYSSDCLLTPPKIPRNRLDVQASSDQIENGCERMQRESGKRSSNKVSPSEKRFPCRSCDKSFTSPALWDRHSRTHSGARPHTCHLCGANFARSHHLNDHLATHSKAKPFRCNICKKDFVRRTTLETHIKSSHIKEKKFRCEICGANFVRKDVLKRHVVLKHERKAAKSSASSENHIKEEDDFQVESEPEPGPGSNSSGNEFTYFEDISVSSVMSSYDSIEPDFVLAGDSTADYH